VPTSSIFQFSLQNRHTLVAIPSASGMAVVGDFIYVVGDNSPWLFKLDRYFILVERIAIFPELDPSHEFIFPKKDKPDLEAMTVYQSESGPALLIFGSGTKSPQRDVCIEVTLGESLRVRHYSLVAFYTTLRAHTGLSTEELNIEGVEVIGDELLLLNRGVNLIIRYSLSDFLHCLNGEEDCPVPQITRITLPKIDGIEAGFSGAAVLPNTQHIVFVASVENTSNWIDDGEVLGSFIGILPLNQLNQSAAPECKLVSNKQEHRELKVESVAVFATNEAGCYDVLLVTDSDGAQSELLTGSLVYTDTTSVA